MFSKVPHTNTLLRWVHDGRIQPQPKKVGKAWQVTRDTWSDMARQRLAKNRALPPNLYLNPAGYYYDKHPVEKTQKGPGPGPGKSHPGGEGGECSPCDPQRVDLG